MESTLNKYSELSCQVNTYNYQGMIAEMGVIKITVDSSWIFALEEEQLPEGRITAVYPKGVGLLLIKTGGDIFAIANKCAHMACSLIGGALEGHTLECPCHGWQFDIRTGEFVVAKEIKIPIYDWKIQDGKIFVNLEERKE